MKFTMERNAALPALNALSGVISKRNTVPILQNLLLEASGDTVKISATDLDMLGTVEVGARVERLGATTIEADRVNQIVRALPEGADFTIDLDDGPRAAFKSGRSNFKLGVLPAADFPTIDAGMLDATASLSASAFDRILKVGGYCHLSAGTSSDFEAVYLHTADGTLRAVSADGVQMAYCGTKAPDGFDMPKGLMLMPKTVAAVRKLLANVAPDAMVSVGFSQKLITFDIGAAQLVSKVIGGEESRYPAYDRVIPTDLAGTATLDTDLLIGCVTRALIAAESRTHTLRLEISDDGLRIASRDYDASECLEEMEAAWSGLEPKTVHLNGARFIEMLAYVQTESLHLGLAAAGIGMSISETGSPDWLGVLALHKGK